jgi:hypothetical protein
MKMATTATITLTTTTTMVLKSTLPTLAVAEKFSKGFAHPELAQAV